MALDDQRLLAAIDAAREDAYGSENESGLPARRAEAIERYLGLNRNPAPEGRSQVVSRDTYETISTMLPTLVRIFANSSDDVCKAVPVGPDDEGGAEQTTAVLNNVVTQQNPWEQLCADWIHDAMLLCNGYAMAYWDKSEKRLREVYEGQSEDQLALLAQDKAVQVLQQSARPDEQTNADNAEAFKRAQAQYEQIMPQWQQAAQMAQQQGQQPPPQPQPPQPPPQVMLYDLVIERVEEEGKVCLSILPPEHCYVSAKTPNWLLKECPYFEFRQQKTIADLIASGLDVPEDVSDDPDIAPEDQARDRFGEQRILDNEAGAGVMRLVWARMIWVRGDIEDDGISRLYHVIAVGRTILFAEPTGRIPVSSMVCQPLPHRHIGMSIAETVADLEDIKTAVTRGGLDNLYLANNGRHVISSRVNVADFLDNRPGGVVRMLDDSLPSEGHVMPLVHPVAFEQIIGSLEFFDQARQNRTGASRYFSGTDANAINKTASGTIALQNMAAMRVEHIARTMAPAVEELFSIVHELISKHSNKAMTVKLRNQWTVVDPQAWRKKRDIRISVGVGAGNKESMQQQLAQIFGAQLQLMPMGVAGPENLHNTVMEMAKLAGFANPAKFWTDPTGKPPVEPPPMPEMIKAQSDMQIEQFRAQQEQQKFQAEQALEQQRLQLQAQVDQSREEMQARQKLLEARQKAELEQQKAVIQASQEQARLEFEKWKAELDATVKLQIAGMSQPVPPDLSSITTALQQLGAAVEELSQPAQIVRDVQTGRAIGVQRGKKTMSIARGPDGRAVGLQ